MDNSELSQRAEMLLGDIETCGHDPQSSLIGNVLGQAEELLKLLENNSDTRNFRSAILTLRRAVFSIKHQNPIPFQVTSISQEILAMLHRDLQLSEIMYPEQLSEQHRLSTYFDNPILPLE